MHVAVVGGSDAGIEAARRCRELEPGTQVTLLVADEFPNFSICGIPYYVSGEVGTGESSRIERSLISRRLVPNSCSVTR